MILNKIQQELNAPKNQRNSFGNYNYRSCEDILQAVKPLLGKAILTIDDEIILIGDRYYVKATATLRSSNDCINSVSAYARESLNKKGMDEAQITGAASSYARKYALNGLFCIDDTKDADTQDNTLSSENTPNNGQFNPYSDDDNKEWLDIDKNTKAWDACKEMFQKGMTTMQVVVKMRTKYKVSKKAALFIETELPKGEL